MSETDQPPARAVANGEHRIIAAGYGGQGVLTLGKLLCVAAMNEGRMVTYLPSYGAEVRGGTANCQVVISPEPIYSPVVEKADALIMLNQLSYERFIPRLKRGGVAIVNSSIVDPAQNERPPGTELFAIAAGDMAARMGEVRAANIILLGAFVEFTALVGVESCRNALEERFGGQEGDLLRVNLRALEEGRRMVANAAP